MGEEYRDVVVPLVAVLVHPYRTDIREVLVLEGLLHMVIDQAPQLGVVLPDLPGNRPDRHVLHQGEYHPLHHQGEAAAASCPGHRNGPHLAVGRDDSGDFCGDVATVLEEIEMPPGSFSGIVDLATLVESWILETRPFLKIDPYVEFQQRWLLLGRNHLQ